MERSSPRSVKGHSNSQSTVVRKFVTVSSQILEEYDARPPRQFQRDVSRHVRHSPEHRYIRHNWFWQCPGSTSGDSRRKENPTLSGQYSHRDVLEKVFVTKSSTYTDLVRLSSMTSTSSNLSGSVLHPLGVQPDRTSESVPECRLLESIAEDTQFSLSASSRTVLMSGGYRSLRMPVIFGDRQILHPSRRSSVNRLQ